ncbi:hypothetical protein BGZ96_010399 [Linnemannia gamsii]|uniref:Uncharacterized protein n=1 Tax=Linnemannia gamsii TaxID=64522 RepID=A0ABQ7JU82_9FUNG|nr:hypothetical protein BGZ96_010399 [Linnemannia gamsii]
MDFFSDPNPRTSASSTGIYDRKCDGAIYELDYIPFAKSSSTIVKQAGFNNTATAASNFLPMQQASDDRWGPEFPDGNQTAIATF